MNHSEDSSPATKTRPTSTRSGGSGAWSGFRSVVGSLRVTRHHTRADEAPFSRRQSFPLSPAIRRFALNRLHTQFTTATVSFLTPRTPYRLPYSHRTLRFAATASHVLCRRPLLLNLFGELRDRLLKLALIAQVDVKQAAELRAHAARPIRRVEAPAVHTVSSHAPFSQTSV